jgi:hypothetical protein
MCAPNNDDDSNEGTATKDPSDELDPAAALAKRLAAAHRKYLHEVRHAAVHRRQPGGNYSDEMTKTFALVAP